VAGQAAERIVGELVGDAVRCCQWSSVVTLNA
jgi:hypothetical protein